MLYISKLFPKTLFVRFVLIIIIPILVGQILAIFLFYDRHWYNVSYYTSTIIANEISSLIKEYKTNKKPEIDLLQDYLNLSYQFLINKTLPTKQPKLNESLEIFKNILNINISEKKVILHKDNKIAVLLQLNQGILQITFPTKLLLNPTVYIFVLWLVFLTIILLSISIIFSKNQIKSIVALANAVDEFGRGVRNIKYKPTGALEIKKVGFAFLKMKNRIEKQITNRTTMLAMISHDLYTPLTRMKLQLELMNNTLETEGLKQDILTMQQMISSYLDFAKGENTEEFETVLIEPWINSFLNKWNYANIELIKPSIGNIKVSIKTNSCERALSNLINNAIKYATQIKILLKVKNSSVIIRVEDNGPGIEPNETSLVFKPFYRADKSRHIDNSSSVGLGLAITREIIKDHMGTIALEKSTSLGGLSVKIILPVSK